jgi:ZIP family zinc transporter
MLTFVLTFLTAVSTIVGGSLAVRERHRVHLLLGFGAGVLLGAIFLDLLPEALEISEQQDWSSRRVLGLVVVGFLFFYLAEQFLVKHVCYTGDCEREARRRIGRMSAVGIIGHSAIDGASIAAAALVSWRTGLIVALGIIAHDFGDGLNTMLLVTYGERPGKAEYCFLILDALAPMLGAALVLASHIPAEGLALLLGLTSGFFLFTAAGHLLPEAHRRSPSFTVLIATVGGLVFITLAINLVLVIW